MDELNKNSTDKKVFILSPDELSKLGILDAATQFKNVPSSSSSSSKDTPVTKSDLSSIFKGKKLLSKNKNGHEASKKPSDPTNKAIILSTETSVSDRSKSTCNTKKLTQKQAKNINNVTHIDSDQTDEINRQSEDTREGKTEILEPVGTTNETNKAVQIGYLSSNGSNSNTRLSTRSVKKESANSSNIITNERDQSNKRTYKKEQKKTNSAKLEETSTTSKPETSSFRPDLHSSRSNSNVGDCDETPLTKVPKKKGRARRNKEPDDTQRYEINTGDSILEASETEHAEIVEEQKKETCTNDLEEMNETGEIETPTQILGRSRNNNSSNVRTRMICKSTKVESSVTTLEEPHSKHHKESELGPEQSRKEEMDDENNVVENKTYESESTTPITQKRKRGRPPKVQKPVDLTPSVIAEAPKTVMEQSQRGRTHVKVKYQEMDNDYKEFETTNIQESTPTTSSTEVAKKKRGRKRKCEFNEDNNDVQSNTEETFIHNNKKKKTSEEANDTVTITESEENILATSSKSSQESSSKAHEEIKVTCCLCRNVFPEIDWPHHNETHHNNLSWRDGETPISLDDPNVKTKLKRLLSKNKSLTCSNCQTAGFKLANFISHLEECLGLVVDGNVTCAKCNETMPRDSWPPHKAKHNNLAWRVGDHPLDLNDEAFVVRTLKGLVKAKKPLFCEKCGASKKSVAGMLSHMGACGNEENAKIKCEICGREMLPYSLPIHMRAHEAAKRAPKATDHFDVDLNSSSTKRRAATKALNRLKEFTSDLSDTSKHFVKQINFEEDNSLVSYLHKELEENDVLKCMFDNCGFSSREVESLVSHLNNCPHKPEEYYLCKTCFRVERSESEMIKHINSSHDIKLRMKVDTDYVVCDEDERTAHEEDVIETRRSVTKKGDCTNKKTRPLFINNVSKKMKNLHELFSHAFQYTYEFVEKNYNQNDLFPSFKCKETDWSLISEDRLEDYIPSAELSCDVATLKTAGMVKECENYTFKKYELFEIEQNDDSTMIFCGAPIRCMAWLPTPYDSLNRAQILAVGTGKDFDEKHLLSENRPEATVVQFWNFGALKDGRTPSKPTLDFCLGIDEGPVWHLEWCPSGCCDVDGTVEWNRRGLLAVGGSSMDVNVYSIPVFNEDKTGLFYKAKPVLTLKLVVDEQNLKRKVFPTKISWSKVSGHNYIAVGYSDGTVAVYNLLALSDNPSSILLPYKVLKNHSHYISALFFIPLSEGNRWLVSSSFDRNVYICDLYNNDKFSCKRGKVIVDGSWMLNWLCFLLGCDEATSLVQPIVAAYSCREYLYSACNLSYSLSTVLTISASDWLNAFVHGNETGEIIFALQHQMLYDNEKQRRHFDNRYLASYVRLIDKTLQPGVDIAKLETETWHEPLAYKEATRKYGVIFCDTVSNFKKQMVQSNSEPSRTNLYPLSAVNKVSFNPNRQACLHYASGYQVGFIRLHCLNFLKNYPNCNVD
ncbi:unnamed protein product [Phyllotreta striolata]|uniref:C2H2-type domain-containing protein n=1 Tax=Phyllotreta striolata TaxID=444603 RepID=A0A9N9TS81_PHYSR|nr:unnamed protein product [Phyllotreta striolata]